MSRKFSSTDSYDYNRWWLCGVNNTATVLVLAVTAELIFLIDMNKYIEKETDEIFSKIKT